MYPDRYVVASCQFRAASASNLKHVCYRLTIKIIRYYFYILLHSVLSVSQDQNLSIHHDNDHHHYRNFLLYITSLLKCPEFCTCRSNFGSSHSSHICDCWLKSVSYINIRSGLMNYVCMNFCLFTSNGSLFIPLTKPLMENFQF